MNFKKFKGKIFGIEMNAKEKAALELEVRQMVSEQMKQYRDEEVT